MADEDRVVQLLADPRDIVLMLNWRRVGAVALPAVADVPKDAVVRAVNWDYNCRAFVLTVWHPTFDEVAPGGLIPRRPPFTTFDTYVFKVPDQVAEDRPQDPVAAPTDRRPWEFLGPPPRP